MKNRIHIILCSFFIMNMDAQILTTDPPFPAATDEITVYYNVQDGNGEIPVNTIQVFAHTGIVSQQDEDNCVNNWNYVQGNWGTNDPNVLMTNMGGGMHKIVINPSTFYNAPDTASIGRLMFVFRNQTGSLVGRNADGSDIFLELYQPGFHAGIIQPYQAVFIANQNEVVPIHCASSEPASLTLTIDGQIVAQANNATELDYDFSGAADGGYNVVFTADNGTQQETETILININPQASVLAAPTGIRDGINIMSDNSVVLQLFAPNKDFVYVLGDFNDWQFNAEYLMNRTPDGNSYWLQINDLQPGVRYRFQYSIDAEDMRVADVYSDMILDNWNDPYIPEETYPNLPEYPCGTTQPVSTLMINEPQFNWTDQNYFRPPGERLVIYELLVRDFIEERNYITLMDSLDYLQNMGITAIQLMPINEFEGNDSWGYNPAFYFAPDKAYGTKEAFKQFINECHNRGIAVILDIALNHSFGQNPMVRMYFNPDIEPYGQPTAESPWFNEVPKHDFNVGYDFNHESPYTRQFCKRVLEYWIEEYHVDGYRFDLSKGFTQNNTLGNIAAWNGYDQSRINILNDYYNHIQSTEPGAYVILEHLSDNNEETVLAANGMFLWGKMNEQYTQAAMGFSENSNLNWGVYSNRGWSAPRLVTYAESHDEERKMYKTLLYGNGAGDYSTQNLNTALKRMELVHTFLIPFPGPKMIWQFGELGYDYSINHCPNDGTVQDACRTYAKPVRWDYKSNPARYNLYQVVSALNHLKKTEPLFSTANFSVDLAGLGKRIHLNGGTINATIIGNFDVNPITMVPGFQHTGTWYDYFTGAQFDEQDLNNGYFLQPGEYHLYIDQAMNFPDTVGSGNTVGIEAIDNTRRGELNLFPNPANDIMHVAHFIAKACPIEMEVCDITGTKVLSVYNGMSSQGMNLQCFDVQTLSPGTYWIRIKSQEGQIARPFIVIH